MFRTIFHKTSGETKMYEVDASAALQRFPREWSDKPWPGSDGASVLRKKKPRVSDEDASPPEQDAEPDPDEGAGTEGVDGSEA